MDAKFSWSDKYYATKILDHSGAHSEVDEGKMTTIIFLSTL